MKWSSILRIHTHILDVTVKHAFAKATWRAGFVHPCIYVPHSCVVGHTDYEYQLLSAYIFADCNTCRCLLASLFPVAVLPDLMVYRKDKHLFSLAIKCTFHFEFEFNQEHTAWISKNKSILLQAWTGPEFLDSRHMKVARLSALRTSRLYPQEIHLVLVSATDSVDLRAIVRPEESR